MSDDWQGEANAEMVEGYIDGGDPDAPEPNANRSHSYRHGFAVARFDRAGEPAFGGTVFARELAAIAEQKDESTHGPSPTRLTQLEMDE